MANFERNSSTASDGASYHRLDTPIEEEVRTVRLERYLVQAWKEIQPPSDEDVDLSASVFARKSILDQPILRSDRINHILTYAGAFNPPHKGHVPMLSDGFYNSGPGLNIVSALLIPISDDGLRAKEDARKGSSQLIFTQKQRAALLTAHLRQTDELRDLGCKTKVWLCPSMDPIPAYMHKVMELAADDGFQVEFVSLKGPDHLCFDKPIKHPAIADTRKIIFSEITRANDDAWVNGKPKPLMGDWSPWSKISSVTGDNGVTSSVWESTLTDPAGSAVRLLTDDNKAPKLNISSSGIRKMILDPSTSVGLEVFNQKLVGSSGIVETMPSESLGLDVLLQKLREAGVISPEMLAEFLIDGTH